MMEGIIYPTGFLIFAGIVLSVGGFLTYGYREKTPSSNIVFGMLYIFFGGVLAILGGLIYLRTEDLVGAMGVGAMSISFITLGLLSVYRGVVISIVRLGKVIDMWRRRKNEL